jgi:hypothetical protein
MISGTHTVEDYIAANRQHCRTAMRRQRYVLAAIGVAGLAALALGKAMIGAIVLGGSVGGSWPDC